MKRNGLVFVPREPPKRVILYPTQDSTSQQQLQQPNGFPTRAKTALVTKNNQHETVRQLPLSSLPNGTSKQTEKFDNDGTVSNTSGQPTSLNNGQKIQNPYYANPFFRPKIVTNQSQPTTTTATANLPPPPPSRDSSTVTTTSTTLQTLTSASTTLPNRGRPPMVPKPQNPLISSNGRTQESEITVETSPMQEDNRRWAHNVASAPIARRTINDERQNVTFKSSETNIPNPMNSDTLKQKVTSATDIVISLMDTWRAPINPGGSSAINIFTRTGGTRDDSILGGQTLATGEQVPSTAPFLTVGSSSTASNNNQNWKKALVANFQKNSRNNPTAKLFTSKQTTVPLQPSASINSDLTINQQSKPERTMILNGLNNERTFQVNENTPSIPSLMRKSTESLRMNNNNNNNNNIERSSSLLIQPTTYSNSILSTTTVNKTEETAKPTEISNPENTPQIPLSIPPTLINAKPPVNVDQQRAIITRVMIRRDFVKSTESKPPMPIAANFRSLIPPQSAKPGGLPTNNIIQVATITENNTNVMNSNTISNRMYPFQQPQIQQQQQQQQQSIPLSQKSLLSFTTTTNSPMKESLKIENNQQQFNGITNDSLNSSSITKMQQSQIISNNGAAYRSTSLSAANADSKRKKEELINKFKKRAISASSAISNDG